MNKVSRWVFRMSVKKLLISLVKIRIFCPKKSKFGLKMAFLFILGQTLPAHLVGGCGARAVSRKTSIYFMLYIEQKHSPKKANTRKTPRKYLNKTSNHLMVD